MLERKAVSVAQLVEKLLEMPQELPVYFEYDGKDYPLEDIFLGEAYVEGPSEYVRGKGRVFTGPGRTFPAVRI
jgi:hypothetical protein